MEKNSNYLKSLLSSKGILIQDKHTHLINIVSQTAEFKESLETINSTQEKIITMWNRKMKVDDFMRSSVNIPNATVGKPYTFQFDLLKEPFIGIRILEVTSQNPEILFNPETQILSSTFTEAGQFNFEIKFNLEEETEVSGIKVGKVLVNPDPKSLWKNIESDHNDPYWKEDNVSFSSSLGSKKLIVGSKRGRSHAHEGIFRDDHFSFNFSEQTGWGIIAVADGAGSAKYSRKGAQLACDTVVDYFINIPQEDIDKLAKAVISEINETSEISQKEISSFCITHLGKAAFSALNSIKDESEKKGGLLKDYSTTLLFAFVREFANKLFVSSFWVGDGGIGIFTHEPNNVSLLGIPDSGEFSGQTRFLTMPEIFADNAYITRIKYKIVDVSSKLLLMTDGITDAKFQTDSALENLEVWNNLINDLEGQNEDGITVNFEADIKEAEASLMCWMDFWSPGNHDDRTIAILY